MDNMTICEKVAYIKGLAEGLDLDSNDKNSKVLKAIIELLEDVALTVEDYAIAIQKGNTELKESIDKAIQELIDAGEVQKLYDKYDLK